MAHRQLVFVALIFCSGRSAYGASEKKQQGSGAREEAMLRVGAGKGGHRLRRACKAARVNDPMPCRRGLGLHAPRLVTI